MLGFRTGLCHYTGSHVVSENKLLSRLLDSSQKHLTSSADPLFLPSAPLTEQQAEQSRELVVTIPAAGAASPTDPDGYSDKATDASHSLFTKKKQVGMGFRERKKKLSEVSLAAAQSLVEFQGQQHWLCQRPPRRLSCAGPCHLAFFKLDRYICGHSLFSV